MRSALPFNESELMDFWNQSFESVMIALLGVNSATECSGRESRAKNYERDQSGAARNHGVALLEATAMPRSGLLEPIIRAERPPAVPCRYAPGRPLNAIVRRSGEVAC